MADPVVVQGTAVQQSQGGGGGISADPNFQKGEKQESKCRDPFWAFLAYANVAAIVITLIFFRDEAFQTGNGVDTFDYTPYIWAVLVCGIFSLFLSGLMLVVMMRIPQILIKVSLIFVVVLSGVWAVMGFIYGNIWMGIMGLVFFAIGVCYAFAVWSRIPFATANLVTSCTAVRSNCGVVFISFLFVGLAFGWSVLWSLAFMGVFNDTYSCTTNAAGQQICTDPNYGYIFLLFLSYFFAHQVIQNTVHVIVAGTVGNWWFAPEDNGCCGTAVLGATCR